MNTDVNNSQMCEELWNQYEPALREICKRRLDSCPSEIDDVISDTYLALCKNINAGEVIQYPKAWLYGTLNNIIKSKYNEINRIRKTQVSITYKANELFYNVDFDDEKMSYEDIENLKREVMAKLDEQERVLVDLIYVKTLRFKEIANILGTSESAIKQKNYR